MEREKGLKWFFDGDNQAVLMQIDHPQEQKRSFLRAIVYHQVFSSRPRDIFIQGGGNYLYITSSVLKNAAQSHGNQLGKWITYIVGRMQDPNTKTVTFYPNESEVNI